MRNRPKINFRNIGADILSGVVVGLVSIPISMGYAQIAGLPAVYGLYGSLLPILLFGLLTSSPQFVVGVDAMPAVMVGSALSGMGLTLGSAEAVALVPVISLLTGLWFLAFYLLRLGRVVKYISTPVMGGFISGVGATIILMQLPKLFGGDPGTGELFVLLAHLAGELPKFNLPSALFGLGTVILILLSKRLAPKLPMSVLLLLMSVVLAAVAPLESWGIKLLPATQAGLPRLMIPQLELLNGRAGSLITLSLTIALVVMAQTLLASSNYAMKYHYKLDNRQELLAYAAAEMAGAAVGGCPLNGSVSRSGLADQFGCKSQLMSVTASLVMLLVLLFGTPYLSLMPVPVLTGIVLAALIGILEIPMAKKLWRCERREFLIFLAAFFGVLLLGTMGGVLVGVALSFFAVVVRAVVPPRSFLGMIPGHEGLYDLERSRGARPIQSTVLYRFSGNLFFANVDTFQTDVEGAVRPDTRQVVVDGQGIGHIDITAAERLLFLEQSLHDRGIRLYLTGHVGAVNDQLRQYGAEKLIETGAVRRTVFHALRDAGLEEPYALAGETKAEAVLEEQLAEFEWLFGVEADNRMESLASRIAEELADSAELSLEEAEKDNGFGGMSLSDEETLLDRIELMLETMAQDGRLDGERLESMESRLEAIRAGREKRVEKESPATLQLIRSRRDSIRQRLLARSPERAKRLEEHLGKLRK